MADFTLDPGFVLRFEVNEYKTASEYFVISAQFSSGFAAVRVHLGRYESF